MHGGDGHRDLHQPSEATESCHLKADPALMAGLPLDSLGFTNERLTLSSQWPDSAELECGGAKNRGSNPLRPDRPDVVLTESLWTRVLQLMRANIPFPQRRLHERECAHRRELGLKCVELGEHAIDLCREPDVLERL